MAKPDSEVSHRKFAERLERQANDGHGWNKAPDMLREAAKRIRQMDKALEVSAGALTAQVNLAKGPISFLLAKGNK